MVEAINNQQQPNAPQVRPVISALEGVMKGTLNDKIRFSNSKTSFNSRID